MLWLLIRHPSLFMMALGPMFWIVIVALVTVFAAGILVAAAL